jgi:hypothetical protein
MGIALELQATYEISRGFIHRSSLSQELRYPYVRLSSGALEPFVALQDMSRMDMSVGSLLASHPC